MKNIDPRLLLDDWADQKVKDLIFSCVFNVKMVAAGQCRTLLKDMTEIEYRDYRLLLESYLK